MVFLTGVYMKSLVSEMLSVTDVVKQKGKNIERSDTVYVAVAKLLW